MSRILVIAIPEEGGMLIWEIPEFRRMAESFKSLIDIIDLSSRGKVNKPVVRALQRMRTDMYELADLRLTAAAIRAGEF